MRIPKLLNRIVESNYPLLRETFFVLFFSKKPASSKVKLWKLCWREVCLPWEATCKHTMLQEGQESCQELHACSFYGKNYKIFERDEEHSLKWGNDLMSATPSFGFIH